jgi:hypothetical protein
VLAASSCDVGVVAYGMTVLVTRAGDVLTPASRPSSKPPSAMSTQHPHGGRSRIAGRRAAVTSFGREAADAASLRLSQASRRPQQATATREGPKPRVA